MRILYVEDEQLLAEAVTHLLEKADINVDWAEDGEEGLAIAASLAKRNNWDLKATSDHGTTTFELQF